jgi:hypothetical protein
VGHRDLPEVVWEFGIAVSTNVIQSPGLLALAAGFKISQHGKLLDD